MPNTKNRIRIGADVGGTFTDVVLDVGGKLTTAKVPTDVVKPEQGILNGVAIVLEKAGIAAEQIDSFIHGTTLATNALIERKGAKTALITTEGFRDSLEIAYENRFDQYDLMINKPLQLVPHKLRFMVPKRMNVRRQVLRELDVTAARLVADHIIKLNIESVAFGLLHSYANADHEQKIRDILLGHTKLESTVRYLGIEVADALAIIISVIGTLASLTYRFITGSSLSSGEIPEPLRS